MVELVDTRDLKSLACIGVRVRPPLSAHNKKLTYFYVSFLLISSKAEYVKLNKQTSTSDYCEFMQSYTGSICF